ncbi:phospholipase [Delitschia confertaspora ATCC 74209]|uniref:Phospholipase n=1 Tax=Delitschia confertaspora ATCC 74209 TaxID=1513339 RepID=A0A9P4JLA6_9PLEO|nr:phospholipase [Delitschia confertaspora ATCC 74209]
MATLHDVHTPTLSACSTLPVSQPQPVDGRTIDNTGYCILSLDGGGIRGLSTLYILKSIMEGLNNARKAAGLKSRKPCEIFDLIGGTSTGGLIAIMLGHLEMSVDECIEAYNKMMKRVFEKKKNRSIMGITLKVQARFESEVLKEAISQVIREAGASPNEPFENGRKPKCKVFVCTKTQETNTITHLRNYILPRGSIRNPSILEAALATSAAPTYFTPVEISGSKFVDGAIGANNPAVEVEEEASDIWCEESGQLQPLVKCFISVGTGNPGYRHVSDRSFKYFVETLQKVASETEATNQRWQGRWRKGFNDYRCFRFNVNGLENVGLAEYKEKATIKGVTDTYLEERHTLVQVRRCVENLRMKECTSDRAS